MEFKKTTNKYAQENSIRSAAKKVSWLEKSLLVGPKEEKVTSMKGKRFRLGGGQKLTDVES